MQSTEKTLYLLSITAWASFVVFAVVFAHSQQSLVPYKLRTRVINRCKVGLSQVEITKNSITSVSVTFAPTNTTTTYRRIYLQVFGMIICSETAD